MVTESGQPPSSLPAWQSPDLSTYLYTAAVVKIPTNWSKQLSIRKSPGGVVLASSVSRIFHTSALYPTTITSMSQVFLAYKEKCWDLKISSAGTKQSQSRTGAGEGLVCRISLCCDDKASWKRELETGLYASVHPTAGTFSRSPDQKYERRPHALKQEFLVLFCFLNLYQIITLRVADCTVMVSPILSLQLGSGLSHPESGLLWHV